MSGYWDKTKKLRTSMPNFLKKSILGELDEGEERKTLSEAINEALLKYKEIKVIYKKTGIQPAYFAYIIFICLLFIFIGFFERYLTILIATAYPLYISFKTIQYKVGEKKPDNMGVYTAQDKQKDVTQWLSYWVVYSIFINFEGIFGKILKFIPFYFFFKVIFLLFCYLPQYQLASYIYENCIAHLFVKYNDKILDLSQNLVEFMKANKSNEGNKGNSKLTPEEEELNEEERRFFNETMAQARKEQNTDMMLSNITEKSMEDTEIINNPPVNENEANEGDKLDTSGLFEDENANEEEPLEEKKEDMK